MPPTTIIRTSPPPGKPYSGDTFGPCTSALVEHIASGLKSLALFLLAAVAGAVLVTAAGLVLPFWFFRNLEHCSLVQLSGRCLLSPSHPSTRSAIHPPSSHPQFNGSLSRGWSCSGFSGENKENPPQNMYYSRCGWAPTTNFLVFSLRVSLEIILCYVAGRGVNAFRTCISITILCWDERLNTLSCHEPLGI